LQICFLWAQMTVADEVKNRTRCISLAFVDFLEAIARAAFYYLQPPSPEEHAALLGDHLQADWEQLNHDVRLASWEKHEVRPRKVLNEMGLNRARGGERVGTLACYPTCGSANAYSPMPLKCYSRPVHLVKTASAEVEYPVGCRVWVHRFMRGR
jgi:hypothetical protein